MNKFLGMSLLLLIGVIITAGCTIKVNADDIMAGYNQRAISAYNGVSFFPKEQPIKVAIILPSDAIFKKQKEPVKNMFKLGSLDQNLTFTTEQDKNIMLVHTAKSNIMYLYRSMVTSKMFSEVQMIDALPGTLDKVDTKEMSRFDVIVSVANTQPQIDNTDDWGLQVYALSTPKTNETHEADNSFVFYANTQRDPMLQLEDIRSIIISYYKAISEKPAP